MAELAALYEKYDDLFQHSETINIIPGLGEEWTKLVAESLKKNFHRSQLRAILPIMLMSAVKLPVTGALPAKARRSMGMSTRKQKAAVVSAKLALPLFWLMQQRPYERYVLRRLWGPDAINLIESARKLHKQALAERNSTTRTTQRTAAGV
jgi:hypothetical protein